ncbi:MAG: hypothetical protein MJ252_01800 [archaeon]|nr:hypothetical protein [archaeon]
MSNTFVCWEAQNMPFAFISGGLGVEDNITFITNTKLNKSNLKTKYCLSHPDEKDGKVGTKSEIVFVSKPWERISGTFITNPSETSAKFLMNLLQREKHKLNFIPKYTLTKAPEEEDSKSLFNIIMNYQYSNKIMTSLGLENLTSENSFKPLAYTFTYIQGKNLSNKKNLNWGLKLKYNTTMKVTQMINFLLSFKNDHFNSLLEFDLAKKQESQGLSSVYSGEADTSGYEKSLILKMCNKFNEKLSCGGETNLSFSKKSLCSKLYAKYKADEDTFLKALWDDKDKSLTFGLTHLFRKFLKTGINYKITPNNSLKSSKNGGLNLFKTKFGFSAEIQESLY